MTAEQALGIVLAHLVGDYLIQSHWMAVQKVHRWWPAIVHAVTYGLPFLFVTQSPLALAVIVVAHAVIDRYRLARHLIWAKNFLAPKGYNPPWSKCYKTGYPNDTQVFLSVWLMIIADNTLHLIINSAAVAWL